MAPLHLFPSLLAVGAPLLCLLLLLVSPCVPSAFAADDSVLVKVFTSQFRSPPISPHFIGFSLEHDMAWTWTGLDHVRPSFVTLMSQLSTEQHRTGGPLFRIGGNSADYSLYNPQNLPLPNATSGFAYTWSINDTQIAALQRGVEAVRGQLVFGLSFRNATNASHAIEHARAIERIVGWESPVLKGLEVGNEVAAVRRHPLSLPSLAEVLTSPLCVCARDVRVVAGPLHEVSDGQRVERGRTLLHPPPSHGSHSGCSHAPTPVMPVCAATVTEGRTTALRTTSMTFSRT